MTAWELRDDLALYRDGALVGMLLDRDTAAEVVDSLRTSGEANARLLEDSDRRVQDLQREFRRQMAVLERRVDRAQRQCPHAGGRVSKWNGGEPVELCADCRVVLGPASRTAAHAGDAR